MTAQQGTRGHASSQTYARLRDDVVSGAFPDDTPLLEDQLAARYGVSRTPVREALRRLEQDGLVQRGVRGYEVRSYTADDVYDIYEARILLESHAARRAAEQHRDADAWRLQETHHRMSSLPDTAGPSERVAANQAFHRAIWGSAGNRTVLDMLDRLYLHLVRHTTLTDADRWRGAIDQHGEVLAAILERRADDAEQAMAQHIASGRNLFLAQKVREGEDGDDREERR